MSFVVASFAGVFGLLIGSFLNVVIYRVPLGKSIVHPRSSCTSCNTQIAWYDNLPIISWLLLRGKCRNCGARISPRYPAVELLTGLVFALVGYLQVEYRMSDLTAPGGWLELVAFLIFLASSIALAAIDLEHFRLPTPIIYFSLFAGATIFAVISLISGDWSRLLVALACAAGAFAFFGLIHLVVPHGMGLGDVRLSGLLGLFLGWIGVGATVIGLFLGFALGALFGALIIAFAGGSRKTQIPFGPWMIAGSWISLLCGEFLWQAYWALNGIFA